MMQPVRTSDSEVPFEGMTSSRLAAQLASVSISSPPFLRLKVAIPIRAPTGISVEH